MPDDIRALFLSTADTAIALLADPAVGAAWDGPSALPEMTVRALAGHLAQQVFVIADVLAAEGPTDDPIPVIDHYRRAAWRKVDVHDPVNTRVREGSEAVAADGQAALVERARAAADELAKTLAAEPADRRVYFARADWVLTLDGFLTTRLLELVVHCDDLAASVGVDTPPVDPEAYRTVVDLLVRLSVERHGQPAVLRALTRAERAPADITAL
ncbi:maleylpyruvate isomerase N-terminal domain-containing protein [Actinokineospora soli]|uniref:Maleylpyruvate isomerase N-terminal domain-containing protein n=1 Tax=Actinokineospora soli TaxID=1048753 RepID=A0ABW2TM04_9PSEU